MKNAVVPEPAKGTDVVMRKLSVALVGWKNRPHATFQSGGAVSDDMFAARLRVGPGVAAASSAGRRRGGAATRALHASISFPRAISLQVQLLEE